MKRIITIYTYFLIFILFISVPAYCSSDSGLNIQINNYSIQVRMFDEHLTNAYDQFNLREDFFYILSFYKQNYSYFTSVKEDCIIWLEYINNEIIIKYETQSGTLKLARKNKLSLCAILEKKYGISFDKNVTNLSFGYSLIFDYTADIPTEIYLGALPGLYEHPKVNALIAAYFNDVNESTINKNGSVYRKNKNIILTIENFDEYLRGYL